ncbi:MAG TPA: hypothetical protein VII56_11415 [Rhizomicrobium sp.]
MRRDAVVFTALHIHVMLRTIEPSGAVVSEIAPSDFVTVSRVREQDVKQVYEIAQRCNVSTANLAEGFLISSFSYEEYVAFFRKTDEVTFLVARGAGGKILGFLLAYNEKYALSLSPGTSEFRIAELLGEESAFAVVKQLAVDVGERRKRVAQRLYFDFLRNVTSPDLFTAIVQEPPNVSSETFHRCIGYVPVLQNVPPPNKDGQQYPTQIWHRSLRPGAFAVSGSSDVGDAGLSAALGHATDLYLHEDNLNWTKTQLLVSVFFALMAAGWYFVNSGKMTDESMAMGALLVASGFLILTLMRGKLLSGLAFMASHKKSLRILEARQFLQSPGSIAPLWQVPRQSKTVRKLAWLPEFAIAGWLVMSLLLLHKIGQSLGTM